LERTRGPRKAGPGTRRTAAERGIGAAVQRSAHVRGRNTVLGRCPGTARHPERGGSGIPPVARCADPPAARTGPGMTATLGTRLAVGVTKATRGGGDRRQLNPWAASRCDNPLPTSQRPPWRAALGREDAGLEKAFGESRIQCLLSARRTQPPRTRLGQRRTRGAGMVSPWRFLPPGAAPASGRATAPRSDSPGVC
jgi:hypothetical protein